VETQNCLYGHLWVELRKITVLVSGAKDKGDVKNTDGLEEAYQLGNCDI
jgi:hypothetical protein